MSDVKYINVQHCLYDGLMWMQVDYFSEQALHVGLKQEVAKQEVAKPEVKSVHTCLINTRYWLDFFPGVSLPYRP